jgi:hypothetical protein
MTGNDVEKMDLTSNGNWSFTDIISIRRVWADVAVLRQHNVDINDGDKTQEKSEKN